MSVNKMQVSEKLIALLRYKLCGDRFEHTFSEEELNLLIKMAKRQALLPLVSSALVELNLVPSELKKRLINFQLLSIQRHEQLEAMQKRVSAAFVKAGIHHLLLKGAITTKYYPEPWMRTRSDVDILIDPKDVDWAIGMLTTEQGFTLHSKNYHDVGLISKNGLTLELHFNLLEREEKLDRVLSDVWQYVTFSDDYVCRITPEFFVFHQIAHTAYHYMNGGCGARFLIDLYLLDTHFEFDRKKLRALCQKAQLSDFYDHLMQLVDCWFGKGTKNELIDRMEQYLMEGSVFGSMANQIAAQQGRFGGKFGYIRARLFWSYDDLKEQYPSLNGKRYLTPIYQMRRWFRLVGKDKVKEIGGHLRMNQQLNQDKVSALHKLLRDSGL